MQDIHFLSQTHPHMCTHVSKNTQIRTHLNTEIKFLGHNIYSNNIQVICYFFHGVLFFKNVMIMMGHLVLGPALVT